MTFEFEIPAKRPDRLKCSTVNCRKLILDGRETCYEEGINIPICDKCLLAIFQESVGKLMVDNDLKEKKWSKAFAEATRYVVSAGALPC